MRCDAQLEFGGIVRGKNSLRERVNVQAFVCGKMFPGEEIFHGGKCTVCTGMFGRIAFGVNVRSDPHAGLQTHVQQLRICLIRFNTYSIYTQTDR